MAYDEHLASRIRNNLSQKRILFEEKKMMGGWCAMVDDKMCVGVIKDDLMARIAPEMYNEALTKEGCRQMAFTGRPLRGFVVVDSSGTTTEAELNYWVNLCLAFNPRARSSKRRKN